MTPTSRRANPDEPSAPSPHDIVAGAFFWPKGTPQYWTCATTAALRGMGRLLTLAMLIVGLAIIQASVMALLIALLLALLFAVFTRPRETVIFLGSLVMIGFASAHPVTCIITVGVVGLAVVMVGMRRRSQSQLLLTDDREQR